MCNEKGDKWMTTHFVRPDVATFLQFPKSRADCAMEALLAKIMAPA